MLIQDIKQIKTKKCNDCGKVDVEEEFATASYKTLKSTGKKKRYTRNYCHSCYYIKVNKKRRISLVNWYREIKLGLCCDGCGWDKFPEGLDFHHVDPTTKFGNVSDMVFSLYSKKRILEEIAKCEVLCLICHAKETFYDSTN